VEKMKWVEANIGVKKDEHIKCVVLLEFVAPLVGDIQSKVECRIMAFSLGK